MGVKQLWGILEPTKEVVDLDSLSGQVVAVDLGFWVVQMQMAVEHHPNAPKRNVTVIAVSDGDPPALKAKTMRERQNERLHPQRPWFNRRKVPPVTSVKSKETVGVPKRSRFRAQLRECCRMVSLMGVEVVEANGEAEAFCSFLNLSEIVDGVITDDSDAFLYGAKVVYRHFNLDSKVPTIERYKSERIAEKVSLDRHDMIALALLLGCDYSESLCKREAALMYLDYMRKAKLNCFDHLNNLRKNPTKNDCNSPAKQKRSSHCRTCKHPGTEKQHQRHGCRMCGSGVNCSSRPTVHCDCSSCNGTIKWSKYQRQIERNISTAVDFPVDQITDEYLRKQMGSKIYPDRAKLTWRCPQLMPFVEFMTEVMEWPSTYSAAKVLPLVITWSLRNFNRSAGTLVEPIRLVQKAQKCGYSVIKLSCFSIVKERVRNGMRCLQVEWKKLSCDMATLEQFYDTIEPLDLVQEAFPKMVSSFLESRDTAKSKGKKLMKPTELKLPTCVKKADLNVSLKLFDLSESDDETEDERPASPKRVSEGEWDLPPCIDTPVSTADLSIEKDDINVIFNQLNISAQDPLIQDSKKRESGKVHKIQLDESRDENSSPLPLLARLQSKLSIKDRRPICFPKLSNMSNKAYK